MIYHDDILQLVSQFSTHAIGGKLRVLETNPKCEEILTLYPIFFVHLETL